MMAKVSEMGLNSLLFSVSNVCITILYLLKLRKSCDGGSYTRCTFLKTPQDVLGPKTTFKVLPLSSGNEVFSLQIRVLFFVNVGFYCVL